MGDMEMKKIMKALGKNNDEWFGIVNGKYGLMEINEKKLNSRNPINHWKKAYTRYAIDAGGAAMKDNINGILQIMGVVAALIGALILAGLQSPPDCIQDFPCAVSDALLKIYGGLAASATLMNLATVVNVTITAMWVGLYQPEEILQFIDWFYIFGIALPATTMSCGILLILAAMGVRTWMVYGEEAFFTLIGFAVAVALPICIYATCIVFKTVELKTKRHDYEKSLENEVTEFDDSNAELIKELLLVLQKHVEK